MPLAGAWLSVQTACVRQVESRKRSSPAYYFGYQCTVEVKPVNVYVRTTGSRQTERSGSCYGSRLCRQFSTTTKAVCAHFAEAANPMLPCLCRGTEVTATSVSSIGTQAVSTARTAPAFSMSHRLSDMFGVSPSKRTPGPSDYG